MFAWKHSYMYLFMYKNPNMCKKWIIFYFKNPFYDKVCFCFFSVVSIIKNNYNKNDS